MNYFAHGVRFLDRPHFLAGTACPDWLSVADRDVRLRSRRVAPFADDSGTPQAEFAAGVLRHLADDDWFHTTRAFHEVTATLARAFRPLGEDDGFRAGFLGHIGAELLLDAVLIDRKPSLLDDYYRAFERIDPQEIRTFVAGMAIREPERLPRFIGLFRSVQFLRCYTDPQRLLTRINQVLDRVRLPNLPSRAVTVLEDGYGVVAARADELLPAERFGWTR
ncbi:MAG: hypothetical protein M3552_17710 [Planctomycetota bacterium]|nr:hypothetical protein [Planctomycetaceae bacterium]MDQ3332457.1 hypothetical protein [Planctomycetota bacterium]